MTINTNLSTGRKMTKLNNALSFTQDSSQEFADSIKQKIAEFNGQHWDASQRQALGLKYLSDSGQLLAGLSGRTFGKWLLIDNFWIDDSLRGQGIGRTMLAEAEAIARQRGCSLSLLDTLDFQARPFYEKQGYVVQWTQAQYPIEGCKYFMVKQL